MCESPNIFLYSGIFSLPDIDVEIAVKFFLLRVADVDFEELSLTTEILSLVIKSIKVFH